MKCRFEKEGFEFKGRKLGEKIFICGYELVIVGFDEESEGGFFINATLGYKKESKLKDSVLATCILENFKDSRYSYTDMNTINYLNTYFDSETFKKFL